MTICIIKWSCRHRICRCHFLENHKISAEKCYRTSPNLQTSVYLFDTNTLIKRKKLLEYLKKSNDIYIFVWNKFDILLWDTRNDIQICLYQSLFVPHREYLWMQQAVWMGKTCRHFIFPKENVHVCDVVCISWREGVVSILFALPLRAYYESLRSDLNHKLGSSPHKLISPNNHHVNPKNSSDTNEDNHCLHS